MFYLRSDSTYKAVLELEIPRSCSIIQAGYQVWTAEQECRQFRNQSAEHSNVIQQSQSAITEQETQTEELFVVRRDQQQVMLPVELHHCKAALTINHLLIMKSTWLHSVPKRVVHAAYATVQCGRHHVLARASALCILADNLKTI